MYRVRNSALLVVLLGLLVATNWALYVRFLPNGKDAAIDTTSRKTTPDSTKTSVRAKLRQDLGHTNTADPETDGSKPKRPPPLPSTSPIDVALIDPNGTSVIAGSAKPKSKVVVSADGVDIATVDSDANGEWVLTTKHKFKTSTPELKVSTFEPEELLASSSSQDPEQTPSPEFKLGAASPPLAAKPAQPAPVNVAERLTHEFEKLVETARKEKAKQVELQPSPRVDAAQHEIANQGIVQQDHSAPAGVTDAKPASATPLPHAANVSKVPAPDRAPTSQKITAAAEKAAVSSSRKQHATATRRAVIIPIPIGFVYREATLTEQGQKAISLLAQYLTIKEFKSVILTGHADERGSEQLNLDLSQARLDAVAREIEKRGYAGNLELIAKGESEPYSNVDRSQLSKQELYALDRRVELKDVH